ncbi:MAG: nucleotidyltransferase domain-containing protein [Peptococcaceae bacterium]|nr:nucleotidyltransferase domain-containing protein [Peptococcaceae bacterium]
MTDHIYTINEISSLIAPIAREYGVGRLTLFGSYARGDAASGSDIDLRIADNGDLRGYMKLGGMWDEIREATLKNVDLVPTDSVSDDFLSKIAKEEVVVYEKEC